MELRQISCLDAIADRRQKGAEWQRQRDERQRRRAESESLQQRVAKFYEEIDAEEKNSQTLPKIDPWERLLATQ